MRQAGRFLPQYRTIRESHDIISICKDPELFAEVSSLPVDVLKVDAAIMFADIMLPLEGMGIRFKIRDGVGPIISNRIRELKTVVSLQEFEPETDVSYVLEAIALTKKRLDGRVPLIGFCGAPFTLASYLIEGRPARDFTQTRVLMYQNPSAWNLLLEKLSAAMSKYLLAQINAGVDAIQVFDSWAGCLSPSDYRMYVSTYSQRIFDNLKNSGVPLIHFGTGTATLLEEMKQAGGNVFGVDWRVPIDEAWRRLGWDVAIQGNLDPAVLLGGSNLIKSHTMQILNRTAQRRGHIFNLGHGILPDTPVENVVKLVEFVHDRTRRESS
jgi:uroporphyrinogen decarboxylase